MAEIRVKTRVDNKRVNDLIDKIYKTCATEPNLSYRPKKELLEAYNGDRLLIATDRAIITGWLLIVPYNKNFQELATGYVVESYRSKGVFNKLLQEAFDYAPTSLIVTFNQPFADYLLRKIGFKNSSLWEAIILSRGKFLLNRLNIGRLKAIRKHYKTGKPVYTVFTRQ